MSEIIHIVGDMKVRKTAKTHPEALRVIRQMGDSCSRLRARIFCLEVVEDAQTRHVLHCFRHKASIKTLQKRAKCTDEDLEILVRTGKVKVHKGVVTKLR
jgi:hypothetical protein